MADYPQADEVDILVICEGAYPYITGGVSSWLHKLMTLLPNYTFGVVFLGSQPSDYGDIRYEFPENMIHYQEQFLFNVDDISKKKSHKPVNPEAFGEIKCMHDWCKKPDEQSASDVFSHSDFYLDPKNGIDLDQFLHSKVSWDYIVEMYNKFSTEPSFIDYFWTVRNIHMPLWRVVKVVDDIPKAKAVHVLSTGYAGFLGSLISQKHGYPLILSEHGIYTKERRIDLMQTDMLKSYDWLDWGTVEVGYLRELWVHFFESLAKLCYESSTNIISLYNDARLQQLNDGADEEKTEIVPNGVDISAIKKHRHKYTAEGKKIICLLGRVVPIKDIKTLIRSMKIIYATKADCEAWIVGPSHEDEHYIEECKQLVDSLELTDCIHFKGTMNIDDVLPNIDLMVLSSISEGMPLVVLESFSAGIPMVLTEVGACKELIEGADDEDKALGKSGRVVNIVDSKSLADAILELITDEAAYNKAQQAAIARVEKYYDQEMMVDAYHEIYEEVM